MYCPKCGKSIKPVKITILPKAGAAGGAIGGGVIGTHIGLAALGTAVSGLLPVAVVGAGIGYLFLKNVHQCPSCKCYFKK